MRLFNRRVVLRMLALAFALGLLWFTLRTISIADIWRHLRQMQPALLLPLMIVNAFIVLTFSARWWLLLFALGYRIPYFKLMAYRLAAFAVSYFTPGPHFGGEPLQVYLVTSRHQTPASASLTAVVLDKALEMLVNFTFLLGGFLVVSQTYSFPPGLERTMLVTGVGLLLVQLGVLALLWRGRRPASSLLVVLDGLWQRLRRHPEISGGRLTQGALYRTLRQSEDQIAYLCNQRPAIMLLALSISALSWLGIVAEFWLMTEVLGLNLTLGEALIALLAARIAILLPFPAALGALEASQVIAISALGLSPASGASLSLLIRSRDILFGLAGLSILAWLLWRRKGDGRHSVALAGHKE